VVPGDTTALHGGLFARSLGAAPTSVFLAEGSSVTVSRPEQLGLASNLASLRGAA